MPAWVGDAVSDRTGIYLAGFGFVAAVLAAALLLMWRARPPAGLR